MLDSLTGSLESWHQCVTAGKVVEEVNALEIGEWSKPLYKGKFLYAGGHPEVPRPDSMWRAPQVRVTGEALEHLRRPGSGRRHEVVFRIPLKDILAVRQEQTGGWGPQDRFVVVVMQRRGRTYEVKFKALGFTKQKDSFAFYAALNAALPQKEPE
jgi:hypothetical protein